jgi:hypothetical protein
LSSASTTFCVAIAGVVHARQPERDVALHALPAHDHVLQRVVEHVAEREHAGDVRRRQHEDERRLVAGLRVGGGVNSPRAIQCSYQRVSISCGWYGRSRPLPAGAFAFSRAEPWSIVTPGSLENARAVGSPAGLPAARRGGVTWPAE